MKPLILLFFVFLIACSDSADRPLTDLPPDQYATELSFARMAKHGSLEPVLDVGQQLVDWKFIVNKIEEATLENGGRRLTYHLRDNSGIGYTLNDASARLFEDASYGEAITLSGEVMQVDRDLSAGEIDVVLSVTNWR